MKPRVFVFAGGGTGGHLFPGLAIAEQLRAREPSVRCIFACSTRPLDAEILSAEKAEFVPIPAEPFALSPRRMLRFVLRWGGAVRASRMLLGSLAEEGANVDVVAMGGFVAAPFVQAAHVEHRPVTMVNLDATPGRANRWIARKAKRIFTAAEVPGKGWTQIAPIVRIAARPPGSQAHCRTALGLAADRPTLLVTGASQGAQTINQLLISLVTEHPQAFKADGWQVIHQTGKGGDAAAREAYQAAGIPAVVRPFFQEMGAVWGAADAAVSRSGAGSVAEAWAACVPTVFMPYPYHRDLHQRANALPLARRGACIIAPDAIDATANVGGAGKVILEILATPEKRATIRRAIGDLGPANGAEFLADQLLRL